MSRAASSKTISEAEIVRADQLAIAGSLRNAIRIYRALLQDSPAFPGAWNNLGSALYNLGEIDQALDAYRRAYELNPRFLLPLNNLVRASLNSPNLSGHQIRDLHVHSCSHLDVTPLPLAERASQGRLRVGYVSANFRRDPEYFFTYPVLRHHDQRRVDVYCYSGATESDCFTKSIQRLRVRWRDISSLTDKQAADRIQRDKIEILVNCSGHWKNGRLGVFALRPAPVQISLSTYPATSGLSTMTRRITDRHTDPPGMTEEFHTERLARIPQCGFTYMPPKTAPRVASLPALRNGFVTFGVFNRRMKINSDMLHLWSAILKDVKDSRLVLQHSFATDAASDLIDFFRSNGVAESRVRIGSQIPHEQRLQLMSEVDIGLDTFPYHGMTTTCEALWMGAPSVVLEGSTFVSRVGVSILKSTGLTAWIARSSSDYRRIAVSRASRPKSLAALRETMRARMRYSPLCDSRAYTRKLEEMYLTLSRTRP